MSVQTKYITSILSTFSTFLETFNVSQKLVVSTTEKFIKFTRNKKDLNKWTYSELENFIKAENVSSKSAALMRKFITDYTPHQVDVFLQDFLSSLKKSNRSISTIKNYRSDIQQLISLTKTKEIKNFFDPENLREFVHEQLKNNLKISTIKRKLTSISQYAVWAESENLVEDAAFWISDIESLVSGKTVSKKKTRKDELLSDSSNSKERQLKQYLISLEIDGHSKATIKNYKSDISQFFKFTGEKTLDKVITQNIITDFVLAQKKTGLKNSSIKRKLTSISGFALWSEKRGNVSNVSIWIHHLPTQLFTQEKVTKKTEGKKKEEKPLSHNQDLRLKPNVLVRAHDTQQKEIKNWSLPIPGFAAKEESKNNKVTTNKKLNEKNTNTYSRIRESLQDFSKQINTKRNKQFLPYFNLLMLIIFVVGLGVLGYRQFIKDAPAPLAYPSTPVRPNRELSFQGRLTDTAQNPITSATNMAFRLYDNSSGGTQLWSSGTCSVTPDQDGIFNVGLGDSCGAEISEDVFSENSNVWLEVDIAAETLTPRQSIKTVAYALNSETVQGYPVSATGAATVNTILTMDSGGQILLGEVSPTLKATTGTFSIEAQTLSLETSSGSDGNISLSPDGTGTTSVLSDLDVTGYLTAPGATISATYAGGTALVAKGGPSGTGNIQEWQNSAGTVLSNIEADGDLNLRSSGLLFTDSNARIQRSSNIRMLYTGNIDATYTTGHYLTSSQATDTYSTGTRVNSTKSVAGTQSFNGLQISTNATHTTGSQNLMRGMLNVVTLSGAGNLTSTYALHGRVDNTSTGTIGDARGAFIDSNINSGGGTITNNYGLYLGSQTVGTNNYSIYTNSGDVSLGDNLIVRSGGNIGIGSTNPAAELDIVGDIYLSSGLSTFGTAVSDGTIEATQFCTGDGESNCVTDFNSITGLWKNTANVLHPKDEFASIVDLSLGGTSTASANIHLKSNGESTFGGEMTIETSTGVGQTPSLLIKSTDDGKQIQNFRIANSSNSTLFSVTDSDFNTSPFVDIRSGRLGLMIGGDNSTTGTRTDATDKLARIAFPHRTNAEEPHPIFLGNGSTVAYGGGSSLFNAVTQQTFYTAANSTTVTGNARMVLDNDSLTLTGAADAKQLIVKGNSSQTANLQEWQNSGGTTLSYVDGKGQVGIYPAFTSDNTDLTLDVYRSYRHTSGNAIGSRFRTEYNPSSSVTTPQMVGSTFVTTKLGAQPMTSVSSYLTGGFFQAANGSSADVTTYQATGGDFYAVNNSSVATPTLTKAIAGRFNITANDPITTSYGNLITTPSGGGVVNSYGLYIEDHNVGSSTNYSIYTNAGNVSLGDDLVVRSGGNIGIGSTAPAYELDLVGELNLTDAIRVAGDAGTSGYFLTSSAGGAMTWTDPSTLTGGTGLWSNTLNVIHPTNEYASIADLAIGGTSTASAKFQVFGDSGRAEIDLGSDSIGLTIQADAAQTANLQEWQNSAGTMLSSVGDQGHFGIGATPNDNYLLNASKTFTNTSGDMQGVRATITANPSSASSANYRGLLFSTNASTAQNITGSLRGLTGTVTQAGAGTLTTAQGAAITITGSTGNITTAESRFTIDATGGNITTGRGITTRIRNTGAGTLSTGIGFYVDDAVNSGGGTFTNNYGLLIENQNVATNNYAIYTNAGDVVLNAGNDGSTNVGIGLSSPIYDLDLVGEFNLTDAIRIAGDAGTSGYLLTSSAGGANTWTDPRSIGLWDNTLNVFHPTDEFASVADLALGGTSTGSANIHLRSDGEAYLAGNVGIGSTSPGQKLDVVGSGIFTDELALHGASVNSAYGINIGSLSGGERGINISSSAPASQVYGTYVNVDNPGGSGANFGLYASQTNVAGNNDFAGVYVTTDGGKAQGLYTDFTVGTGLYAYGSRHSITGPSASIYGTSSILSGDSSTLVGAYNNLTVSGTGTGYGVLNDVKTTSDATVQTAYANYTSLNTYSGAADVAYGNYVIDGGSSTGGTQYGLYVDLDDADVTNYSIYVEPGSGDSYFGSNVGIGTSSPIANLEVRGTTTSDTAGEGQLVIGIDNPYWTFRQAAAGTGLADFAIDRYYSSTYSEVFRIQRSTGNIGIGTTTPNDFKLEVAGDIGPTVDNTYSLGSSSRRWLNIYSSGNLVAPGLSDLDGDTLVQVEETGDEDKIRFDTAGSERMIIDDAGLVGIGTTTPISLLDVEGSVTGKALVQLQELGDQDILTASNSAGTTRFRMANTGYMYAERFVDVSNSSYFLDPAASGTSMAVISNVGIGTDSPGAQLDVRNSSTEDILNLFDGASEVLTVIDGGNVGIGTTAPDRKLDIVGTSASAGAINTTIQNTTANGWSGLTFHDDTNAQVSRIHHFNNSWVSSGAWETNSMAIANNLEGINLVADGASGNIEFFTGGHNRRMIIDNNGNVGIGTTTSNLQLDVQSAATDKWAGVFRSSGTPRVWLAIEDRSGVAADDFSIWAEGKAYFDNNVGIGSTSPTAKLNIVATTGAAGISLLKAESTNEGGSLEIIDGATTGFLPTLQFASSGVNIGAGFNALIGTDTYNSSRATFSFSARNSAGTGQVANADLFDFQNYTTSVMRINNDGNVGIGTTVPSSPLHVYRTNSASSPDFIGNLTDITQSSSGVMTAYAYRAIARATHTSGTLSGIQANSTQAFFSGSGGTTSYGDILTSGATISSGATVSNLSMLKIYTPGNSGTITNLKGIEIQNMTGGSSNYAIYSAGGRSYHAGNFGIGTTNPTSKLEVAGGNIEIADSAGDALGRIIGAGSDSSGINLRIEGASNFWQWEHYTNTATDFLTINYNSGAGGVYVPTGNLGVGTTSPSQKLHVSGNSLVTGNTYIGSTDSYFYRDAANRIATPDQFYVQAASANTYLYSTNTYLGSSSGDTIHTRGNVVWVGENTSGRDGDLRIRNYTANAVSDGIKFYEGGTRVGEIGVEDTTWLRINQETAKNIYTPRMIRADAGFQVDSGNSFTVLNGGNVGINAPNPSNRLVVNQGTIKINTSTSNGFFLNKTNDSCLGPGGTDDVWTRLMTTCSGGSYAQLAVGVFWANGATRFDLAEFTPVRESDNLIAGDIVMADPTKDTQLTRNIGAYNPSVFGIVSDVNSAAMVIGAKGPESYDNGDRSELPIALAGRVLVKMTSENGFIQRGDPVTTSNIPGFGMKMDKAGATIGKSMDEFDPTNMTCQEVPSENDISWKPFKTDEIPKNECYVLPNGTYLTRVTVFVGSSWYDPSATLAENGEMEIVGDQLTGYEVKNSGETVTSVSSLAQAFIANIQAGITNTKELIVENTAIIKDLSVESFTINGQTLASYIQSVTSGQIASNGTALISPVGDDTFINIATQSGEIAFKNSENETVTSISESGDVSISGNTSILGSLVANEISTNSITASGSSTLGSLLTQELTVAKNATIAGSLTVENNASVSGTLIANQVDTTSARISALEAGIAELETVKAATADIVTATVSGTLYADNIYDFENKIAQTLQEPSLLELISGTDENSTSEDQLADLYSTVNKSEFNASSSAQLDLTLAEISNNSDDVTLTGTALFIEKYFKVNGSGFISDSLAVGNTLFVGETMQIADGTINFTSEDPTNQTLRIQPEGQGSIELLAGIVTIDDSGKVVVNGDLEITGNAKIAGTLLTDQLKPTDFGNPLQVQVAGVDTQSNEVKKSRFEIINEVGTPVATFSAEGNAEFAGDLSVAGKAEFDGGISTSSIEVESQDLGSNDENDFDTTKTSGKATIKSGANEVTIRSSIIEDNTLIYVTATGSTDNQVLYVKDQRAEDTNTPEQDGKFVVGFDNNISEDVSFNWWIVN